MADVEFTIKRGDRLPILRRRLQTDDCQPIDLTGATVNFIYQIEDGSTAAVVGAGVITIVDATAGVVEYAWGAADNLVVGVFNGEFEAQIGGLRLTAPNGGYIKFEVFQDLGDAP